MTTKGKSTEIKNVATSSIIGRISAPVIITTIIKGIGFTTTWIMKSKLAAKIMSIATVTNDRVVISSWSSGSLVTTCQSIGVVGLSTSGYYS